MGKAVKLITLLYPHEAAALLYSWSESTAQELL